VPSQQSKKVTATKAQELDAAERAAGLVGAEEFVNLLNDRWRFAWLNFRAGIYRGIGLTIGVALIIVLLGWLVTVLGGIPYIGDFVREVQQSATAQPTTSQQK
jgi:Zn-dependent membrane protease YugP